MATHATKTTSIPKKYLLKKRLTPKEKTSIIRLFNKNKNLHSVKNLAEKHWVTKYCIRYIIKWIKKKQTRKKNDWRGSRYFTRKKILLKMWVIRRINPKRRSFYLVECYNNWALVERTERIIDMSRKVLINSETITKYINTGFPDSRGNIFIWQYY